MYRASSHSQPRFALSFSAYRKCALITKLAQAWSWNLELHNQIHTVTQVIYKQFAAAYLLVPRDDPYPSFFKRQTVQQNEIPKPLSRNLIVFWDGAGSPVSNGVENPIIFRHLHLFCGIILLDTRPQVDISFPGAPLLRNLGNRRTLIV